MSTFDESESARQTDELELAGFMRLWGVKENEARGMLELRKVGIRWAAPIIGEDEEFRPNE